MTRMVRGFQTWSSIVPFESVMTGSGGGGPASTGGSASTDASLVGSPEEAPLPGTVLPLPGWMLPLCPAPPEAPVDPLALWPVEAPELWPLGDPDAVPFAPAPLEHATPPTDATKKKTPSARGKWVDRNLSLMPSNCLAHSHLVTWRRSKCRPGRGVA